MRKHFSKMLVSLFLMPLLSGICFGQGGHMTPPTYIPGTGIAISGAKINVDTDWSDNRYGTNSAGMTNLDARLRVETNRAHSVETNLQDQIDISALSYQPFSTSVLAVNGTATVAYANSSLVRITPTTDIVVTFDNTAYPTNGANSVIIELLAGTNTITFDTTVITNVTAPTISTNSLTSLFFRRVITNLWYGRQ